MLFYWFLNIFQEYNTHLKMEMHTYTHIVQGSPRVGESEEVVDGSWMLKVERDGDVRESICIDCEWLKRLPNGEPLRK